MRDWSWRDRAACRGKDPELWFPVSNTPGSAEELKRIRLAKAICRDCPVWRDCLEHAVSTPERFGIWGGLDERQRGNSRLCRGLRRQALTV